MQETKKYIEIRFNRKNGKITTRKSTEDAYHLYGQSLFSRYNGNTGEEYEFFVTSTKEMRRDIKKHFGNILKELDKEQKRINKSYAEIQKLISNSKNL